MKAKKWNNEWKRKVYVKQSNEMILARKIFTFFSFDFSHNTKKTIRKKYLSGARCACGSTAWIIISKEYYRDDGWETEFPKSTSAHYSYISLNRSFIPSSIFCIILCAKNLGSQLRIVWELVKRQLGHIQCHIEKNDNPRRTGRTRQLLWMRLCITSACVLLWEAR